MTDQAHPAAEDRNETEAERQDRKWDDMLQEFRVIQTSAQLSAGFLLTLPFQQRFADLDRREETFYLALVLLAALLTALVLTPVAIHRRLSGDRVKEKTVAAGQRVMRIAIACLALLITGIVALVFEVVVDRSAAVTAGVALLVVLTLLLGALPRAMVPHGKQRG